MSSHHWDDPVVDATVSTAAQRTLKAEQQKLYVMQFWIFLASVIALVALVRAVTYALSRLFRVDRRILEATLTHDTEKGDRNVASRQQLEPVALRRIPIALVQFFRIIAFRTTIPIGFSAVASISELTFICGYITAMFVWLLINTENFSTVFYEDRAAHLASCQLPFIVALAGKNGIISFLTGVGHEKLNVLHRAAARTCLILLWMHAICRASAGLPETFDFSHGWMRAGALGLSAFTVATVLSMRPIRQVAFEFFLVAHIILVGTFMLGGYFHARKPGFGDYIWPALVLWAFDRVLRAARIVYNNGLYTFSGTDSTAIVELLSGDTVRLTLRRRMHWKSGQHAYVTLPSVSGLPSEAHPFTIASIDGQVDGTAGPREKDVVFLIRGRSGFTGRLRDHAVCRKQSTVTALVDGPYGCPPDLSTFSTCVLIAGGSGVSYTLSLLMETVRLANAKKSCTRRVVFVWALRDDSHLRWFSKQVDQLLRACPSSLVIEPRIYTTRASTASTVAAVRYGGSDGSITPPSSPTSPMDEKAMDEKFELPSYSSLTVYSGRPDIQQLLEEEVELAAGPVSVDVAGPAALSQSVRKAVRTTAVASPSNVLRGMPTVTLHVETFGMVKG